MAENQTPSGTRVLVALDSATMSARALETAARLAALLGAQLEGLFVEDADLVRLGGLPFAREIDAVTGVWRALAADEVERSLRLEGARLERLMAQAAERARVPWSFATARGRLLVEAVARDAELTLLGTVSRSASATRRSAIMEGARTLHGSLAVLFDATPGSLHALELAGQLAAASKNELRVLVRQSGQSELDAPALNRVRSWLTATRASGQALPLRAGEGALAEALRSTRSELLIWAAPDLAGSLQVLATMASGLSCPLLVVRRTSAAPPKRRLRRSPEG